MSKIDHFGHHFQLIIEWYYMTDNTSYKKSENFQLELFCLSFFMKTYSMNIVLELN